MVWFQCEDCGDNLKKPKLPNHFNICSATKLSCIDCGEIFGQESVQGHTQCITETEKYGPKGQGKPLNGASTKQNKDAKQKPDFDINVGLSDRPPWFCSVCNTKATSKQALLLHAEGKKHKGKARAFHAAKQLQKQIEESASNAKPPSENPLNGQVIDKKDVEQCNVPNASEVESEPNGFEASNGSLSSKRKRRSEESDDDSLRKKTKDGSHFSEVGVGEVIQLPEKECTMEKIKWKKLITSALKSSSEGVLKMKKLRKTVLKAVRESGITEDEDQLRSTFEGKISSSSKFIVENKYVRLAAKD